MREAIFSALEAWNLLRGSRVLDLYAGSGALGLEAASRGGAEVVLVEKHPQAAQIATRNAKVVAQAFRAADAPAIEVVKSSVQTYLDGLRAQQSFDVIMLDPPYDVSETDLARNLTGVAPLLAADGVVLVERSSRSPEPTWPEGLTLLREKRYGETVLWWAERAEPEVD